MTANKTTTGISWATAIAVLAALAAHSGKIVEAMRGLWLLMVDWTSKSPLGLGSFFLALGMCILVSSFLDYWLARIRCPDSRQFVAAIAGISSALGVMWIQMASLQGLMLGVMAGLAGDLLFRAGRLLVRMVWRRLKPAIEEGGLPS